MTYCGIKNYFFVKLFGSGKSLDSDYIPVETTGLCSAVSHAISGHHFL